MTAKERRARRPATISRALWAEIVEPGVESKESESVPVMLSLRGPSELHREFVHVTLWDQHIDGPAGHQRFFPFILIRSQHLAEPCPSVSLNVSVCSALHTKCGGPDVKYFTIRPRDLLLSADGHVVRYHRPVPSAPRGKLAFEKKLRRLQL